MDLAECAQRNIPSIRIRIEEIAELLGRFADIADTGDHSSYLLITDNNGLNALGADLVAWEFAKDQKDPIALVAAASMQQPFNQTVQSRKLSVERVVDTLRRKPSLVALLSMLPAMQESAGKLHFGADMADQGSAYVGFGDKHAGVSTKVRGIGYGPLETVTTATVGRFGAQFASSPYSRQLSVGASADIAGVPVAATNTFDALTKTNVFNLSTSLAGDKVTLGYANQTRQGESMHQARLTANLGAVMFDSQAGFGRDMMDMAANVSAKMGRAVFVGSYDWQQQRSMKMDSASAMLLVPIGPGVFDAYIKTGLGPNKLNYGLRFSLQGSFH